MNESYDKQLGHIGQHLMALGGALNMGIKQQTPCQNNQGKRNTLMHVDFDSMDEVNNPLTENEVSFNQEDEDINEPT